MTEFNLSCSSGLAILEIINANCPRTVFVKLSAIRPCCNSPTTQLYSCTLIGNTHTHTHTRTHARTHARTHTDTHTHTEAKGEYVLGRFTPAASQGMLQRVQWPGWLDTF